MDEFETMREACGLQHFTCGNEACRIETEFCVFAAARRPFARAFTVKTHANANMGLHADFFRRADRLLQLFELLSNDDYLLIELAAKQRDTDKSRVFVTIANDETLGVLMHRQRGNQFGLASSFKTKMKLLTSIDNFFDDLAQLIDLDRKNSAILVLVAEFSHRFL